MDQEISKGTWLGATILAIVAILGLSFAVYGLSRSNVSRSTADYVNTMDSVGNSVFNDYDGTVVSGLQVRSALENFEGDKIAILVHTSGVHNAVDTAADPTIAKLARTSESASILGAASTELGGESIDSLTFYKVGLRHYINYNAIFKIPKNSTTSLTADAAGYWLYTGEFVLKGNSSDLAFNAYKANYKTTGLSEYIANGANFNAKLIKDGSGTVVGLMFTQVY